MKVVLLRGSEPTGWSRPSVIGAKQEALRLWRCDQELGKLRPDRWKWDHTRYVWAETEIGGVLRLDLLGWRRDDPHTRVETGYAVEVRECPGPSA